MPTVPETIEFNDSTVETADISRDTYQTIINFLAFFDLISPEKPARLHPVP